MMGRGIAGGLEAKKLPQIILSTKRFITYDNFSLISEILFIYFSIHIVNIILLHHTSIVSFELF